MEKQIDVPVYQVITARSADRQYTHTGPAGLERGTLVTVPFGRRTVRGVIVASGGPVRPDMKTLEPVDGTLPPIPAELMDSLEELADYYMVPLGTMLQTALPPALMKDLPVSYRATGKRLPLVLTEDELIVMAMLRESPCRLTNMVQKLGRSATGLLKGLEKMGLVERSIDLSDELVDSVKRRAVVPVGEPDERQLAELKKRAPRQAEVLRSILSERSAPFHLMSELAARFKCGYGLFRSLEQKGLVRTFYDFKSLVNGDRHFRDSQKIHPGLRASGGGIQPGRCGICGHPGGAERDPFHDDRRRSCRTCRSYLLHRVFAQHADRGAPFPGL